MTAFKELIELFKNPQVLRPFEIHEPIYFSTDASLTSIACVFLQKDKKTGKFFIVDTCGRNVKASEKHMTILQLEMLAVLHGLNVFKQFLSLSSEIHLFTDHITIAFYNNIKQNSCNGRISRRAMILSQYSITVHFTKGKKHFLPDLLSRREYPTGIASEIDESGLDEYVLALSNDCNSGTNNEFETSHDKSQLVATTAERHLQLESESMPPPNIRPDTNYIQRPHASADPDSERHQSSKSETNDLNFISPSETQYLTSAISRFDKNSDRPLSRIINQSVKMHAITDNGDYYQSTNTHLFSLDDYAPV